MVEVEVEVAAETEMGTDDSDGSRDGDGDGDVDGDRYRDRYDDGRRRCCGAWLVLNYAELRHWTRFRCGEADAVHDLS